jgi:hypothetical protein
MAFILIQISGGFFFKFSAEMDDSFWVLLIYVDVERCPKKMSRNHLISYKLGLEFAINFDF